MKYFFLLFAVFLAGSTVAQTELEVQTQSALRLINDAAEDLVAAETARDRVRALTRAISAHEEGLAALRIGMRKVTVRERQLSAKLLEQDGEIAALLGVLQRLDVGQTPVALAHPAGPVGSVRAGMLLSDLVPALTAEAAGLREDVAELAIMRDLQENAIEQLETGVQRLQSAREALNLAIADRTELPKRFVNDPVREAILIASSDTMAQFANGLDRVAVDQTSATPAIMDLGKGSLPLPVEGDVILRAGQTDAAGVERPGVVMAVLPQAIVTAPVSATIRYTGPLLDYGQVVILEPKRNLLFVFAGLGTIYVTPGDVVDAGTPLGLMAGQEGKNAAQQSTDGEVAGAEPTETLYIEVRQNNSPEDPSLWFRMEKDG